MFQFHTPCSIIPLSGLDLCSLCSYVLYHKLSCDAHFPLKNSAPGVRLLCETLKTPFSFTFTFSFSFFFFKQLCQFVLKTFKIVKFYAPRTRTQHFQFLKYDFKPKPWSGGLISDSITLKTCSIFIIFLCDAMNILKFLKPDTLLYVSFNHECLSRRSCHHHHHQYQKQRGYYATSDYRCGHKHRGGLGNLRDPFAWISIVSAGSSCKHSGK